MANRAEKINGAIMMKACSEADKNTIHQGVGLEWVVPGGWWWGVRDEGLSVGKISTAALTLEGPSGQETLRPLVPGDIKGHFSLESHF